MTRNCTHITPLSKGVLLHKIHSLAWECCGVVASARVRTPAPVTVHGLVPYARNPFQAQRVGRM